MKIPVYNFEGEELKKIELDHSVFDEKVHEPLLHQVVVGYFSARRSGSASTKTRKEVRGGGKKPWRQKGTGRARAGSIRSPLWRGGGVVFGPHPRDFSHHLTKRIKRQALKSSLNSKLRDRQLLVVEEVEALGEPKTKVFASSLSKLLRAPAKGQEELAEPPKRKRKTPMAGGQVPKLMVSEKALKKSFPSTLLVLERMDSNIQRSSRNIPNLTLRLARSLNALDVLTHQNLIISEEALKQIVEAFAK